MSGSKRLVQNDVVAIPARQTDAVEIRAEAKNKIQWPAISEPVNSRYIISFLPMPNDNLLANISIPNPTKDVLPLWTISDCLEFLNKRDLKIVELREDWIDESWTLHVDKQSIEYEHQDMSLFKIKGRQSYKSFDTTISADFSSATFFFCAAAFCTPLASNAIIVSN